MNAKSQVASLDLIISAIVLLVFLGLIVVLVPYVTDRSVSRTIYGGEVFTAIETMDDTFLTDYHIAEDSLGTFAGLHGTDIETSILGGTTSFDSYTSDLCIFFLKGTEAVDIVLDKETISTGPSTRPECTVTAPCSDDYGASFVYVKPVLRSDEIVTMYVVVCRE